VSRVAPMSARYVAEGLSLPNNTYVLRNEDYEEIFIKPNSRCDGFWPFVDMIVAECTLSDIAWFVERHHYSHSVAGITPSYCFGIHLDTCFVEAADEGGRWVGATTQLAGAAIFGIPAMKQTLDKYSENGRFELLELRRLAMIDDTHSNAETQALAPMFDFLAHRGIQRVLSYSDPAHGHSGVIYRAAGFKYLGQTSPTTAIFWKGKRYPIRNIDQYKDKGRSWKLCDYAVELRAAISAGEAAVLKEEGKHIFIKDLVCPRRAKGKAQYGTEESRREDRHRGGSEMAKNTDINNEMRLNVELAKLLKDYPLNVVLGALDNALRLALTQAQRDGQRVQSLVCINPEKSDLDNLTLSDVPSRYSGIALVLAPEPTAPR
jgi:hypothetical protein